ncbi:DUF11 domain-containing protein [Paenibacillus sp. JDR-2]|uniref:DUF7507 domain-containing protein n=1 Tax=Paenibacillus sp. (strain JDR-2) TaxID=324057 RepID=UPI000166B1A7|nr:DUF11 domain-containing protein [Paenibacillus sp. JDR-2]ACS99004.1 conserved repeat domain protein [Paenibacillus sp. JDR-2]
MPFVNRFFLNRTGGATFTGNTLGLSRSETVGVPGTVDSIGGFTTTNTALTFGTYPAGTTGNFALNSSSAVLVLPAGATVLYAELIWGGTYLNNGVDLSAFINNAVSFTTPAGTFSISPDPATAQQVVLSSGTNAYVRSAAVTSLVTAGGAGTYTTGGVVGTIVIPDPTSNHAGWTLAVFYEDVTQPLRNLSLRVGATVIQASQGPVDTVITGFATPFAGALNGRALVGAQEGDANKTGDRMLFGQTAGSLTALSGPNNFATNFFASQINKNDGTLDTSGTFGTRNQVNGTPGSNIIGGRQGWDITNVSVSSTLANAQTAAVFRLTTNGDGYLVDSVGLQIDIQQPQLTIVKSADSSATVIGDTVEYTVVITNVGMVDTTSVVMFDSAIGNTTLVPGSVTLNGVMVDEDPVLGVPIGTLTPGQIATVKFRVTVDSLPNPPFLKDQATAAYTFKATPDAPPISTVVPSNIVEIPVFLPALVLEKEADLASAVVGDIITYTLTVTNIGNIAFAGVVNDPLPAGTSFVAGSVYVNGLNQPGDNPNVGIDIGVLDFVQTTTIQYQLLVESVPPNNIIHNLFNTAYVVTLPDGRIIRGTQPSNPVNIPVDSPMLTTVKSANLPSAVVGEIITYTVVATNNNATPLTNVILRDNIPVGSSFIPGSVTIDGVSFPTASPIDGIPVAVLPANTSITQTFQVRVDFLPNPPELVNQAVETFTSGSFTGTSFSNEVTEPVVQPGIQLVKRAGVTEANVGDIVNYSVTVTNTGNINIVPVLFDPLNAYSSFVAGTVRINGTLNAIASPITGIPVGTVAPGEAVVVSYDVITTAVPPSQFYVNQANATYTYTPPGRTPLTGTGVSNEVLVRNPIYTLDVVKSASVATAVVGERILYTIEITNNGAIPATDVIVSDVVNAGTSVIPGSIQVNGVPAIGDLTAGLNIGTLASGATSTVTFQSIVTSIPESFPRIDDFAVVRFNEDEVDRTPAVSNTVSIRVTQPTITATKRALQSTAFVGEFINYVVEVENSGSYNALATWFDNLPEGSSFVANSLTVNGFPVPGADHYKGLFLGTMIAGITNVVTFILQVVSYPPNGLLVNQGDILFQFILPNGQLVDQRVRTNPVTVTVLRPPTVTKSVNVSEVFLGDSVIYTVVVNNPESTTLDNAVLQDIVPAGLSFIPGSVSINGISSPSVNPAAGILLGVIGAFQTIRVTFAAQAVFEPENPLTENTASLAFNYVTSGGQRIPGKVQSDPALVQILDNEE